MPIEAVTLAGRHVRLEPLSREHHEALCRVGLEPSLWEWTPAAVRSAEDMLRYIDAALGERERGVSMPFAIRISRSGEVIGSTRYMNVDLANRRVEIGSTWITPAHQQSPANTEAKLLLLRHAFETLGCLRMELKTDSLNLKSRNAILRLGARQDGIFPDHMVTHGGRIRHTVYYSIAAEKWPQVRARLEERLERPSEPGEWVRVYCLNASQADDLMRMYSREWWTAGRERADVARMLDGCDLIAAFAERGSGRLAAFSRVITDYVYKALIFDVMVDEKFRGRGLGARLIDTILGDRELAGVRHFELYCRAELKPFYRRWGFEDTGGGICFLRRG